jgi:uncharacterized membrane protein YphA (DoxX/SURF4 family)
MKLFDSIDQWSEQNHFIWADPIRFLLGAFIVWKGVQFGSELEDVPVIMGRFDFLAIFILVYIVIVQIAAGVVIMLGLVTRAAILCLLPILIGAIIYTPRATKLPIFTSEPLAILTLFLTIGFLFYGSGVLSSDSYFKRHPHKPQ